MKEFFKLLLSFNLKALFVDDTHNAYTQFFRYIFVGGIATAVDWSVLELFYTVFETNLYVATAIGFAFGLTTNYLLSKFFAFKGTPTDKSVVGEMLIFLITGLIGLGLTEGIMWAMTIALCLHHLLSKAVATVIVLLWNFGSKKILLYRKRR